MALTEIVRGMDGGAEAIQANFEELESQIGNGGGSGSGGGFGNWASFKGTTQPHDINYGEDNIDTSIVQQRGDFLENTGGWIKFKIGGVFDMSASATVNASDGAYNNLEFLFDQGSGADSSYTQENAHVLPSGNATCHCLYEASAGDMFLIASRGDSRSGSMEDIVGSIHQIG